jgi:hypothetical protein
VPNKAPKVLNLNCGFDWQNEITYFAQLSHNEKRELFFRILWGKVKPSYYFDGLESQEQDVTNIDHISFHDDGTVHIRYYNVAKKKEKIYHAKLQNTILTMSQDVYGPLLILSVYDINAFRKHIGKATSLVFEGSQNIQYHWEIEDTHQFSLVFFLVGGDVNYKMMLSNHFPSVFNIAASPFLMNYFGDENKVIMEHGEVKKVNDLGLLIGYTPKVIPRPSHQTLVGPKKSKEFTRIENMLGLSLVPSDDKIRRLVS